MDIKKDIYNFMTKHEAIVSNEMNEADEVSNYWMMILK